MMNAHNDLLTNAAQLLPAVRQGRPLVQCLTNSVTPNLVANALLTIGGSPAMVDIPGEAGIFAGIAGATLINLGTPNTEQRAAILEAATAAAEAGKPWVLDPVGVGALPIRTALAQQLLDHKPAIIRGNASEIKALAGTGAGGAGVDSTDAVDEQAAVALAKATGAVVAVSGPVDLITDGQAVVRISNGTELFTQITGAGCALGGVTAAFAAVGTDRLTAAVAACLTYAVAGELAAAKAVGPGSFAVALLDALAAIDEQALLERGKLS